MKPISYTLFALGPFPNLPRLKRFSAYTLHLFLFQNDFFSRKSRVSVMLCDSISLGGHIVSFLTLAASLVVMSDVSLLASLAFSSVYPVLFSFNVG